MQVTDSNLTETDLRWLRESIRLARDAAKAGDQPYGSLLADEHGELLIEGVNTAITSGDCTGHAEINVVREASQRFAFEQLERCTLYASTEPCVMCAGAIFWSRIGRVVYALSASTLHAELDNVGEAPPVGCCDVLAVDRVELLGPALEDEALRVHIEATG